MCTFPFNHRLEKLSANVDLSIIEIECLDGKVQTLLDKYFVSICEGNSGSDLSVVKKSVADLYVSKTGDIRWIMGATAEFFIHLYINLIGFKQECLFLNLEERSIKKGFDGFYSQNNLTWIMESKSGSIETEGICHSSKIKEAITDMRKKFLGKTTNNPWKNAYSHASHYDVGTAEQIRKNIKKMSDDFVQGKFYSIDKFNIMPCATIFLSAVWNPQKADDISTEIKSILNKLNYKQLHIICVTQKTVELFLQYIGVTRS